MRELLEKIFPVLSKNETVVEKSWNLYDLMNLLEFWTFLLIKTAFGTCLSGILEILKFVLVLLLTYALALVIFHFMDGIMESNGNRAPVERNKNQSGFGLRQQANVEPYPYVISYTSKSDDPVKTRTSIGSNRAKGFESDTSNDAVVRVGSFKRSSSAAEEGQSSTIGRAIENLKNANTAVNENPYVVSYTSKSDDHVKTRTSIGSNRVKSFESDNSNDAVVRVGSFKRPSSAAEEGETSAIGRAIEDLKNANTAVNDHRIKIIESEYSMESKMSGIPSESKATKRE